VYDNFLFLDRGNMMQASEAFVQQAFGSMAVQYSAGSFVVNQCLVVHINICDENPNLRKAPKRYR
jgi:hypothetical protein